ncbi:APC family permease [Heyndrickxia acidicola]|uniref:APC family permease n=1 Tax=Heyndrickxia acidicola TaxID=209389 RepID=A0ABU6MF09_9BACI|nr:APC family permease [Heyndrickxia acidicola]MED1203260.1 APC family permease [Heyndrickxia acidicola]
MQQSGKFKKTMSLVDLILIGLGAIFGSAWLFAVSSVASKAGPGGFISWVIGGLIILLIGLVYAELGAALPRTGGILRYPVYSHGPLVGYLISFITIVAYSSLISIEVTAVRQYIAYWLPGLTKANSQAPTIVGWLVQFLMLLAFFLLNYWSVSTFAKSNRIISIFKYFVPLTIIVTLSLHFKAGNFTLKGFTPFGFKGIQGAITSGGVMFAYLGLHPIVSVAGEVKNPKRNIPIALIICIVLSTLIYTALQVLFIGSIPTGSLQQGWANIQGKFPLPFKDIAVALGLGWLAVIVVMDAVLSPGGNGNIFMNTTSRLVYAWSRNGTFFQKFSKVDHKTGIPRSALWLTFVLSVFWTLPFPSWNALVNVCSVALILSYAVAPISTAAFNVNAKHLEKPFKLKGRSVIAPISFVFVTYIVYWAGWNTISWLLGFQILMFIVYLAFSKFRKKSAVSLSQQLKSAWWLLAYYVMMLVICYYGSFGGGRGVLSAPLDLIIIAIGSLAIYYWAMYSGLPKAMIEEEDEAFDHQDVTLPLQEESSSTTLS